MVVMSRPEAESGRYLASAYLPTPTGLVQPEPSLIVPLALGGVKKSKGRLTPSINIYLHSVRQDVPAG